MEKHELNLIEGAMPCAAKTLLIYGMESSQADVTTTIKGLAGTLDTIDLRSGSVDATKLRADLKSRFATSATLLIVVGDKPPEPLRALVAEVQRGELKEGEQVDKVPEAARLFVFSPSAAYAEADAKPFGLQLV